MRCAKSTAAIFLFWAMGTLGFAQGTLIQVTGGGEAGKTHVSCKRKDLQNFCFEVDGLVITIRSYSDRKLNGREWFDLRVENRTEAFKEFRSSGLSVVDAQQRQEQLSGGEAVAVVPKAYLEFTFQYWFDNPLRLPARIYFNRILLAEIN